MKAHKSNILALQGAIEFIDDQTIGASVRQIVRSLVPGTFLQELLVGQLLKRLPKAAAVAGEPRTGP